MNTLTTALTYKQRDKDSPVTFMVSGGWGDRDFVRLLYLCKPSIKSGTRLTGKSRRKSAFHHSGIEQAKLLTCEFFPMYLIPVYRR